MSEQAEEEGSLEEFAKVALRRPMRGSWEALLCQHLVQSVNAEVTQKIRLICEAALMAQDKTAVDMDLVERIYAVTGAFQQAQNWDEDKYIISWPFWIDVPIFDKYIKPWLTRSVDDIDRVVYRYGDSESRIRPIIENIKALDEPEYSAEWFRWVTEACGVHRKGFFMLKVEFYQWALSQMMTVFAELAKLVQPDLYQQVLSAFTGKREQQE